MKYVYLRSWKHKKVQLRISHHCFLICLFYNLLTKSWLPNFPLTYARNWKRENTVKFLAFLEVCILHEINERRVFANMKSSHPNFCLFSVRISLNRRLIKVYPNSLFCMCKKRGRLECRLFSFCAERLLTCLGFILINLHWLRNDLSVRVGLSVLQPVCLCRVSDVSMFLSVEYLGNLRCYNEINEVN